MPPRQQRPNPIRSTTPPAPPDWPPPDAGRKRSTPKEQRNALIGLAAILIMVAGGFVWVPLFRSLGGDLLPAVASYIGLVGVVMLVAALAWHPKGGDE